MAVVIPGGTQVVVASASSADFTASVLVPSGAVPGSMFVQILSAVTIPGAVTSIKINDVVCRDPNYPADSEFIELRNDGIPPVNLTGWRIINTSRSGIVYTFPVYTTRVGPDAYIVVYSGIGTDQPSLDTLYWNRNDQLWFVGDRAELRDASGRLINVYTVLAASC